MSDAKASTLHPAPAKSNLWTGGPISNAIIHGRRWVGQAVLTGGIRILKQGSKAVSLK